MIGKLQYLNESGHAEVIWDTESPEAAAAIAEAEALFAQKVGAEKNLAYALPAGSTVGEVVRAFDPTLERIILTPQMAGGAA